MRRLLALSALLIDALPAVTFGLPSMHGIGYGWWGGPHSIPSSGDTVQVFFAVDQIEPWSGIDLNVQEVTGAITGIVKSVEAMGDGVLACRCIEGRIDIHHDPAMNHDFGVDPPSETAPGTFLDGPLCLAGGLPYMALYLEQSTQSGAFEAVLSAPHGDCVEESPAAWPETTVEFSFSASPAMEIPRGYAFRADISLEIRGIPIYWGFPCFAITAAQFELSSTECPPSGTAVGDFHVRGEFAQPADDPLFDPAVNRTSVWVGSRFGQTLDPGSLVEDRSAAHHVWIYRNPDPTAWLRRVELAHETDRHWSFDLYGRGVSHEIVTSPGNWLQVRLWPGQYEGETQVPLTDGCPIMSYEAEDQRPCALAATVTGLPPREPPHNDWRLDSPWPNPSCGLAAIRLKATDSGPVALAIFDARGRLVRRLYSGMLPAGERQFAWDGRDELGRPVAQGIYWCRLRTHTYGAARKLVHLE